MEKNKTLQLRVSDYTLNRLNELADKFGLSKSETIRNCQKITFNFGA